MSAQLRRRRKVEIYFVLYLAALVLLMPDSREAILGAGSGADDMRLDLQPERLRLVCRFAKDTSGAVGISSMDTVNVIRYFGTTADVDVEAVVEDVETGYRIPLAEGESTGLFSLSTDPSRSAIRFVWRPMTLEPVGRTFRVTIAATAQASNGNANGLARLSASTQFVLSTVVDDRPADRTLIRIESVVDTVYVQQQSGSAPSDRLPDEFWVEPAQVRIIQLAGTRWSNRLVVSGADLRRDLVALPVARSSDARTANTITVVPGPQDRQATVEGIMPQSGTAAVEVSIKRRDGQERTVRFSLESRQLAPLKVPSVLYPEIAYEIESRLPELSGQTVSIAMADGDRWRVPPTTDSVLRFTPQWSDTGRSYVVKRFVDGSQVSTDAVRVRSFDAPEIVEVSRLADGDARRIVVRFHGRKENRPTLEVLEGNAAVRKRYGDLRAANRAERPTISWIEVFDVEAADRSKPFTFRLQAVDRRGARSRVVTQRD
ncbi:MAG: hypothetical protein MUC47_01720 [Candidatus Kapabacteria bacterium]|nr:hypothetical protein [Candidatus Kapabacteria bacterium]